MKFIVYSLLFVAIIACGKNPSPKKVTKKLTDGSWSMTEFIDNDVSILKKYQDNYLVFDASGGVTSTGDSTAVGKWSVGNDRKPTILYLNFPELTDSMHIVSDDWVVFKLTKDQCILKRNNEVGFNYKASIDQLTLTKK